VERNEIRNGVEDNSATLLEEGFWILDTGYFFKFLFIQHQATSIQNHCNYHIPQRLATTNRQLITVTSYFL